MRPLPPAPIWFGFVFREKSPRNVSLDEARALGEKARLAKIAALIIDASDEALGAIRGAGADYLQLHGRETPQRVAAIRQAAIRN